MSVLLNQAELDRLVAQIGEEILARVPAATPSKQGEGLNLPDQVSASEPLTVIG